MRELTYTESAPIQAHLLPQGLENKSKRKQDDIFSTAYGETQQQPLVYTNSMGMAPVQIMWIVQIIESNDLCGAWICEGTTEYIRVGQPEAPGHTLAALSVQTCLTTHILQEDHMTTT